MIRTALEVGCLILALGRYNNIKFNYTKLAMVLYRANCFYAQATGQFLFEEKNRGDMNRPRYDSLMDAYGTCIASYITDTPKVTVTLDIMGIMAVRKAMELKPYNPFDAMMMTMVNPDTAKYL